METYYINLQAQLLRRCCIEHCFSCFAPSNWLLNRVSAVSAADVQAAGIPGRLKEGEKGCYLSHVKALDMACDNDTHAYILEDDAHFGINSFRLLDLALVRLLHDNDNWDILYTQVMPVCPEHMVELLRIRAECVRDNKLCVVDSRKMLFAGACSYVVNKASKHKVLNYLKSQTILDIPVDSYYWRLAREGVLQARVVFPLTSSVNPEALVSQIQATSKSKASLIWNAWMRLSAYDRDLDEIELSLSSLSIDIEGLVKADELLLKIQDVINSQELRIMRLILSNMFSSGFISLFSVIP